MQKVGSVHTDISDCDSEVDTSHIQLGTPHAKKIRKVRFLEDCILGGCVGSEKEEKFSK